MKVSLIAIIFVAVHVAADDVGTPAPLLAADQTNLSFEALSGEMSEFRALSNIQSLTATLQSKRLECVDAQEGYNRATKLAATGHITEVNLANRKFAMETCQFKSTELDAQLASAYDSFEIGKMTVRLAGDPGGDYLAAYTELLKKSLQHQFAALQAELNGLTVTEAHLKSNMESSRFLNREGNATFADYKKRQLEYLSTSLKVRSLKNQIRQTTAAVESMNRTSARLSQERKTH